MEDMLITWFGLIDARQLDLMHAKSVIINISRGGVVAEGALFEALVAERIGGAAVDVWTNEPETASALMSPSTFPFHELDNVIVTPHLAGASQRTLDNRAAEVSLNIELVLEGRPPNNVISVGKNELAGEAGGRP